MGKDPDAMKDRKQELRGPAEEEILMVSPTDESEETPEKIVKDVVKALV